MGAIDIVFYVVVLIMSIVIHEVMHGFVAERFGDPTARYAGRLTLNPLKHIDLFGSIILPVLLVLAQSSFLFGWAKPVPYNPENFTNQKLGSLSVAAAGILANFFIAAFFGLIIRLTIMFGINLPDAFYSITTIIVIINIALGVFNLVPIPPLDGSKILFSLLPASAHKMVVFFERYSIFFLLAFVMLLSHYLYYPLAFFFHIFTGIPLS